ncbi:MAG: asparagine synthase-related protein [Gaiellaceae bacterium]
MSSAVLVGPAGSEAARLEVTTEPGASDEFDVFRSKSCTAVVWGTVEPSTVPGSHRGASPAEAFANAYREHGIGWLPQLRGVFAAVVWDPRSATLFALRDPMGAHPLFYRSTSDTFVLSPWADSVAGDRPDIDAVAAAAYVLGASLPVERTLYRDVFRLAQGHLLESRGGAVTVTRYWHVTRARDGASPGSAAELFSSVLQTAVERCQRFGDVGVYLSGGLDSAAIATAAAEVARRHGLPSPPAIIALYRGTEYDEEDVQRTVAHALGLEPITRTPEELLRGTGILEAALEVARATPGGPPQLVEGIYDRLSVVAKDHGCVALLSGIGGDDWLLPPPVMAADALRRGNLAAVVRLARAWSSYWPGFGARDVVTDLIWPYAVRPLLAPGVDEAVEWVSPGRLSRRRARRTRAAVPAWLAPDLEMRGELVEALQRRRPRPRAPHLAEESRRELLDHPTSSLIFENLFAATARTGVRVFAPLLDPDVVEVVGSLPPVRLVAGGRAKALAAELAGARVPSYARRWPRSVYGDSLWRDALASEGSTAWSRAGEAPVLASLGVLDPSLVADTLVAGRRIPSSGEAARLIRALILETWLQSRILEA